MNALRMAFLAATLLGASIAGAQQNGPVVRPPAVLSSRTVRFPLDQALYPPGPGAAAMNADCITCHSPSMVLTQPRLSAAQWEAEIAKMRETYKAPLNPDDLPAIRAYLAHLSPQ